MTHSALPQQWVCEERRSLASAYAAHASLDRHSVLFLEPKRIPEVVHVLESGAWLLLAATRPVNHPARDVDVPAWTESVLMTSLEIDGQATTYTDEKGSIAVPMLWPAGRCRRSEKVFDMILHVRSR